MSPIPPINPATDTLADLTSAVNQHSTAVNTRGFLPPVFVVETAEVSSLATVPATLDGESVSAGQRVLLNGQVTTPTQNGPWILGTPWTRPEDFAVGGTIAKGVSLRVTNGTLASRNMILNSDVVVGTTSHSWSPNILRAEEIPFEETGTGLVSTEARGAIEENATNHANHVADTDSAHAASAINATPPAGQATWDDVATYLAGLKTLVDAAGGGGGGGGSNGLNSDVIIIHARGGTTDTPTTGAVFEINPAIAAGRPKVDLTNCTGVRLQVNLGSAVLTNGGNLHLQYSTDQTSWFFFNGAASSTTQPGTTASPQCALQTTSSRQVSAWVTPNAALNTAGDVFLRAVVIGANGTDTLNYGTVRAQFMGTDTSLPSRRYIGMTWAGPITVADSNVRNPVLLGSGRSGSVNRISFGLHTTSSSGNVVFSIRQQSAPTIDLGGPFTISAGGLRGIWDAPAQFTAFTLDDADSLFIHVTGAGTGAETLLLEFEVDLV